MKVNLYPQNKNKISLANFANTTVMSFNQLPLPSLSNHISVSQDCQFRFSPAEKDEIKTQSKPQRKRRKIFQPYHTATIGRDKVREYQRSQQNTQRLVKVLRKVKSNLTFDTLPLQESKLDKRIEEINNMLESHRAGRSFHLNNESSKHNKSQKKEKIIKTEQKLYQTTQSTKNQQVMITSKIPTFQKKIQNNKKAIDSMSHLINQKIEQDNRNIQNLMQMINKSEQILKSKEQQLGRINTELIYKETELMHNKQMSKKRELQLIRMKRIQDLQNQNLQLYQQLERSHALGKFQDFVEQEWQDEVKTSGLQIEQQSTIKHKETGLNASVSANNTIGEILSPLALALNEQQFI